MNLSFMWIPCFALSYLSLYDSYYCWYIAASSNIADSFTVCCSSLSESPLIENLFDIVVIFFGN